MGASLKTVPAAVEPDGTVRLREPMRLSASTPAAVTLIIRDEEPNETTRQAIEEQVEGLPRFETAAALLEELES